MTDATRKTNHQIKQLVNAHDGLNMAAEELAGGMGLPAGSCKDLHERANRALRLAKRLAGADPELKDAWAESFADRGL